MRQVEKTMKNQRGFSASGLLVVLAVGGFLFTCISRMAPAYMEDRYVKEALLNIEAKVGSEFADLSSRSIKGQVNKFFVINNVRNEAVIGSLKVERLKGKTLVSMDYEIRENLFYNVDVVMTFKNHWYSNEPTVCCKPLNER